jgi:hypothetical protein
MIFFPSSFLLFSLHLSHSSPPHIEENMGQMPMKGQESDCYSNVSPAPPQTSAVLPEGQEDLGTQTWPNG